MLEIDDVHTYYGDSYVLQGMSLNVEKGSVVALLGRNGVGKTTLIRSIMGFTPARRGAIPFQRPMTSRIYQAEKIAQIGDGTGAPRQAHIPILGSQGEPLHCVPAPQLADGTCPPGLFSLPAAGGAHTPPGQSPQRWRAADAGQRPRLGQKS